MLRKISNAEKKLAVCVAWGINELCRLQSPSCPWLSNTTTHSLILRKCLIFEFPSLIVSCLFLHSECMNAFACSNVCPPIFCCCYKIWMHFWQLIDLWHRKLAGGGKISNSSQFKLWSQSIKPGLRSRVLSSLLLPESPDKSTRNSNSLQRKCYQFLLAILVAVTKNYIVIINPSLSGNLLWSWM